ncbi:MAG: M20/M25/M40 family metallo-hydrolase, partial [Cellulomonadaceae bacterium]|nr:M20/M25/M40 family metallo-hydrolase [Cellulomonadaceae bacterium]
MSNNISKAEKEVVEICRNLLRIDTSNFGDDSGPGERLAAEYCAELLSEVGLDCELFEARPGRTSLVTRLSGSDPSRPALVLHGHTDVMPAQGKDWTHPPFSGAEIDGMLWGRGAVDMKGMDAMILAVVREYQRTGRKPARDIIIAMFADEEAGGVAGSGWAVENRPELFEGATEAISEVGGYSVDVAGKRAYLIQTAEKGLSWLKLIAKGTAGHGSAINNENAIVELAKAVTAIANYQWPIRLTPTTTALLKGISDLTGLPFQPDANDQTQLRAQITELANAIGTGAK